MKTLFKIIVGFFAIAGLLIMLIVGAGAWFAGKQLKSREERATPEKMVLVLNFKQPLVEQADGMPDSLRSVVDMFAREGAETSLHDVVYALERGSKDPRVLGVVGLFGPNLPSLAQSQEIRAALEKFRAAGKFSFAFAPSYGDFGPGNNVYYLAAAFEKVWLQPVGGVGLSGMRMEMPFGRQVLEKIGVKADFIQREEYKSAMNFLTDDKMSPPVREMMQAMLDDLNAQLVNGIAPMRGMKPDDVRALMSKGPYTAQEALDRKLIDQIGYSDEIEKWIEDKHGKKVAKVGPARYRRLPDFAAGKKPAAPPKATVALIIAEGEISDSERPVSPFGGGHGMNAREIVNAFYEAAEDKEVKQIIFRVDSPGGSPTASETIRRALVRAKEKGKKVIVSMGQMAGSGGYWVAMDGDRIFADPATLTGSIGVVGGKFDLSGLYEKIGLNWEVLQIGEYPGLWSTMRGYTPEERARVESMMDDTYYAFRKNVSQARKIPMEKMPEVSKGRIFTGAQAVKLGLVDELGGLRAAIDYSKTSLGLKPDDLIALKPFPRRVSPAERAREVLRELFGQGAAMPVLGGELTEVRRLLERIAQPQALGMPYFRVQ